MKVWNYQCCFAAFDIMAATYEEAVSLGRAIVAYPNIFGIEVAKPDGEVVTEVCTIKEVD